MKREAVLFLHFDASAMNRHNQCLLFLITSCLCFLHVTNGNHCLVPVLDLQTLFRHSPGTMPKELARIQVTDYSECMKQCCKNTEGLCNVLKYQPLPEGTNEAMAPNCILLSCNPLNDCFLAPEEGVQVYADSQTVSGSFGAKTPLKSAQMPKEKTTDERSGKSSSLMSIPQPSIVEKTANSLMGRSHSRGNETTSTASKESSETTKTPMQNPMVTDWKRGLTTLSVTADTKYNSKISGRAKTPVRETSMFSNKFPSDLTKESRSNKGSKGEHSENEAQSDASNYDGRAASSPEDNSTSFPHSSMLVDAPDTADASGNNTAFATSDESFALDGLSPPNNVTSLSPRTLPLPVSQSPPITQYQNNANYHQNNVTGFGNEPTMPRAPNPTQQSSTTPLPFASTNLHHLNASRSATSRSFLTPGSPQSRQVSLAPSQTERQADTTTGIAIGQSSKSNTSKAYGSSATLLATIEVDSGVTERSAVQNDSVGFAPESQPAGNKTNISSETDDVTVSQDASSTTAVLISALTIGCFFILVTFLLMGKRFFDGWKKRHYSRIEQDYLIEGMYHE